MNLSTIAYLPVDVPFVDIEEFVLDNLFSKYSISHHEGLWDCLPLVGRLNSQEDFSFSDRVELAWDKRYDNSGAVLFNKSVENFLSPIFESFKFLPIQVTHAQILRQKKYVGKHYDLKRISGNLYQDALIQNLDDFPAAYKILLNCFSEKSFFVCKNFESKKNFISIPKETNTFIINERKFPHGADYVYEKKYIVSLFGLVDRKSHECLIEKSLIKYKDFVISY